MDRAPREDAPCPPKAPPHHVRDAPTRTVDVAGAVLTHRTVGPLHATATPQVGSSTGTPTAS